MSEAVPIVVRFGIYLDLMLLFGVPLFGLYGLRRVERSHPAPLPLRTLYAAGAVLGLLLSLLALFMLAASMSGSSLAQVGRASVSVLLFETSVGTAWQARMGALILFLILALFGNRTRRSWPWLLAIFGGIALASLAWGGHGAMDGGGVGTVHLVADIVHLLAAGVWVAALVSLAILLFRPHRLMSAAHVELSHRALASFAVVGTIVVSLLVLTGIVNSWLLIGLDGVASLPFDLYGRLLIAKLLLFLAMLGLAALNRYRMTPALEEAIACGDHARAVRDLRRSLLLETSAAVFILVLVSWMGMLAPPISGS